MLVLWGASKCKDFASLISGEEVSSEHFVDNVTRSTLDAAVATDGLNLESNGQNVKNGSNYDDVIQVIVGTTRISDVSLEETEQIYLT